MFQSHTNHQTSSKSWLLTLPILAVLWISGCNGDIDGGHIETPPVTIKVGETRMVMLSGGKTFSEPVPLESASLRVSSTTHSPYSLYLAVVGLSPGVHAIGAESSTTETGVEIFPFRPPVITTHYTSSITITVVPADTPDECPDDPEKFSPGICGCGVPDTDSDQDGTLDCQEPGPNPSPTSGDWYALGGGVGDEEFDYVAAVAAFGNDVIAAGRFEYAGGVPAKNIARWDGSTWNAMGDGLHNTVRCLKVVNNELYAAGDFTFSGASSVAHIAVWNGAAWEQLGDGLNSNVHCLTEFDGRLIAGGDFTGSGAAPVQRIGQWSGSAWEPVGNGGANADVGSLGVVDGRLIAGGPFTRMGATSANHVARLESGEWQAMGTGLNGNIFDLADYNGVPVACGNFLTNGDGQAALKIAQWNGTAWVPLGGGLAGCMGQHCGSAGYALAVLGGELYVGGSFTDAGAEVSFRNISRWNGAEWTDVGGGVTDPACTAATYNCGIDVEDMAVRDGELIVIGSFTHAAGGSVPAHNIAVWVP